MLDLSFAYQQVPFNEESKPLLMINTHRGLYEFQRLPFGVASAPAIFQAMMDNVLEGITNVRCYFDVIITGSSTEDFHNTATQVLQRLGYYNFTLKEEKCKFFQDSIVFLGHNVSAEGIYLTMDKVKAIRDAAEPANVAQLRAFLGLLNFYAKFLRNMARAAVPLFDLLKKDRSCKWTKQCKEEFEAARIVMIDSDLKFYDVTKPIGLSCDPSAYGYGAVIFHPTEANNPSLLALAL